MIDILLLHTGHIHTYAYKSKGTGRLRAGRTWSVLFGVPDGVGLGKLFREQKHGTLDCDGPVTANINSFNSK